jgi:hypothetical protein
MDLVGSFSAEVWPTTYNLNVLRSLKVAAVASTVAWGVVVAVRASFVKKEVAKGAAAETFVAVVVI